MKLTSIGLLCWALTLNSASASSPTAIRLPNETYQQAAARVGRPFRVEALGSKEAPVQDVSESYWEFDTSDVLSWTVRDGSPATLLELQERFLEIRDEKIYQDPEESFRNRRMAFLFPDDGCHLRAALFNQSLEKKGFTRGHKIFAFGNLRVPTPHHPDGEVLWWFHVAPVFRVKEGLFVADPALFPQGPITLKNWLRFLAPENDITQLRMVTCDAYAHSPQSRCVNGSVGAEEGAIRIHNQEFLSYEWRRQLRLGRDPEKVLGDFPPWKAGH